MAYSNYPKRQNLKILIYKIQISETRKIVKQNVITLTKVNNLDLKMEVHNAEFIDKFEAFNQNTSAQLPRFLSKSFT